MLKFKRKFRLQRVKGLKLCTGKSPECIAVTEYSTVVCVLLMKAHVELTDSFLTSVLEESVWSLPVYTEQVDRWAPEPVWAL